jgi:uncharacterized protein
MAKNIFLIILILIIIYFAWQLIFNNPAPVTADITIKDKNYSLEIAKTIPQKTIGLMNRTNLCPNCGMIFVSPLEMPQVFWMKNTLIPLDIIFLDKNGLVLNIASAVPQPNTPDNQLDLYQSISPSKYVIELNSGDSSKLSLQAGDKIDLPNL